MCKLLGWHILEYSERIEYNDLSNMLKWKLFIIRIISMYKLCCWILQYLK